MARLARRSLNGMKTRADERAHRKTWPSNQVFSTIDYFFFSLAVAARLRHPYHIIKVADMPCAQICDLVSMRDIMAPPLRIHAALLVQNSSRPRPSNEAMRCQRTVSLSHTAICC